MYFNNLKKFKNEVENKLCQARSGKHSRLQSSAGWNDELQQLRQESMKAFEKFDRKNKGVLTLKQFNDVCIDGLSLDWGRIKIRRAFYSFTLNEDDCVTKAQFFANFPLLLVDELIFIVKKPCKGYYDRNDLGSEYKPIEAGTPVLVSEIEGSLAKTTAGVWIECNNLKQKDNWSLSTRHKQNMSMLEAPIPKSPPAIMCNSPIWSEDSHNEFDQWQPRPKMSFDEVLKVLTPRSAIPTGNSQSQKKVVPVQTRSHQSRIIQFSFTGTVDDSESSYSELEEVGGDSVDSAPNSPKNKPKRGGLKEMFANARASIKSFGSFTSSKIDSEFEVPIRGSPRTNRKRMSLPATVGNSVRFRATPLPVRDRPSFRPPSDNGIDTSHLRKNSRNSPMTQKPNPSFGTLRLSRVDSDFEVPIRNSPKKHVRSPVQSAVSSGSVFITTLNDNTTFLKPSRTNRRSNNRTVSSFGSHSSVFSKRTTGPSIFNPKFDQRTVFSDATRSCGTMTSMIIDEEYSHFDEEQDSEADFLDSLPPLDDFIPVRTSFLGVSKPRPCISTPPRMSLPRPLQIPQTPRIEQEPIHKQEKHAYETITVPVDIKGLKREPPKTKSKYSPGRKEGEPYRTPFISPVRKSRVQPFQPTPIVTSFDTSYEAKASSVRPYKKNSPSAKYASWLESAREFSTSTIFTPQKQKQSFSSEHYESPSWKKPRESFSYNSDTKSHSNTNSYSMKKSSISSDRPSGSRSISKTREGSPISKFSPLPLYTIKQDSAFSPETTRISYSSLPPPKRISTTPERRMEPHHKRASAKKRENKLSNGSYKRLTSLVSDTNDALQNCLNFRRKHENVLHKSYEISTIEEGKGTFHEDEEWEMNDDLTSEVWIDSPRSMKRAPKTEIPKRPYWQTKTAETTKRKPIDSHVPKTDFLHAALKKTILSL